MSSSQGGGGGSGSGRGTPGPGPGPGPGPWSPMPLRPGSPYAASPPPRLPPGSPGLPMFAARLPYVPCPRPRWAVPYPHSPGASPRPYRPPPHSPSPTPLHMHPCSPEYFRGVSPYDGYSPPPPFRQSPLPGAPMIPPSPIPHGLGYISPGGYVGVPLDPVSPGGVGYRYEPEDHEGPSTADIIANQSQDYVDEKLAEYQATIQQLQGIIIVFLLLGAALSAKVSQNCLLGITSAAKCCKSIPNGDAARLANPKDCTTFYICRNNKPVSTPCPAEQIWDVEAKKCKNAEDTSKCPQNEA